MPPSSSSVSPPLHAERTIARSRSRYKGPRPHKTLIEPSDPPSFGAELQRLHDLANSPRESRFQNDRPPFQISIQRDRDSADSAKNSDEFVAYNRGSLGKAKDRPGLQDELVSSSQALRGCQQSFLRSGHDAEADSHKEAGQNAVPSHKVATSTERSPRSPGPDLQNPHSDEAGATIGSLALPKRRLTQRIAGQSNGNRLRKGREELKRTISAPIAIEPPQNIPKPAFDAPVSAVNAGERRVKVKCNQKLISLPVTPSTTPLEIIRSAADQSGESIDLNDTILVESFKQLGLERPLRRYEHVRDVLNSWNNDTQNTLVVKPSSAGSRDDWLDLQSVSTSQPVDTSVNIHYSQRPGHWDKRWVTLRSNGQMLVAKRDGGENANICHMSDFDIYIPTARQSAKRIRPPRKICFAVKSQQKSSMFLSTANFVHFFSTSDKTLAVTWYRAILEWRSWYLVNVMGEGQESLPNIRRLSAKVDIRDISSTGSTKMEGQRRPFQGVNSTRASTLANHDTEHLAPFAISNPGHHTAGNSRDDMQIRSRSDVQSLPSKKPTKSAELCSPNEDGLTFVQTIRPKGPEPFATTGLLGRTYIQRQKAQREREKAQNAMSDQPLATQDLDPVQHLDQMLSQRSKPKPLIDLTPYYKEPPQHAKKGRGVILKKIPAGGLVEVANTPEAAISIPPSTTWRRPTSRGRDGPSVGRSRTIRRNHSSGAPS